MVAYFASGSYDKTIKLWDANTGELKQTLKGHERGVISLSYSPDGGVLASGTENKTIKLWDANTGELKQTLKGHENGVSSLSYSPDGGVLASGSYDGAIKLWDANTGELKQTLKKHEGGVTSLSYCPDGGVLASGSRGKMIQLWTPSMLQTQALFYQYDPKQVSAALQFLWEMGLDDDLTFVHKVRKPTLYPIQGRYYADTQFLPLLDYPAKGKTKADQLIQWLEDKKAYKKQ